jgi:hypothetical protein
MSSSLATTKYNTTFFDVHSFFLYFFALILRTKKTLNNRFHLAKKEADRAAALSIVRKSCALQY